ncbi:MAG TPA: AEC family transporter [Anaerolineae bacterium]|nr:AEC family transporter [Anaerolineae bacterium]HQI85087.1 AEC family transporter [Anaerolineae bacterium]
MLLLINVVLPVFLVAGVAAVAQPRLKLEMQTLSRAAFYLFSPAMVLDALVNSDVSGAEFGQLALTLALTVLALWLVGEVAARALRLDGPTRGAFLVAIILMNSGNYGMPINLFAFGEPGLVRASLCVTVNAVITSTLAVYLVARGQLSVERAALHRTALRRVLSVPAIYAAVLGLLVNLAGWTLPETVVKAVHLLGQGLVPASLLILGIQMRQTVGEQHNSAHTLALALATLGRLALAPLFANLAGRLVGLNELARSVATLEMATPAAIMSLILAHEFGASPSFAARCILVTTFASLLTVTLWLNWLI